MTEKIVFGVCRTCGARFCFKLYQKVEWGKEDFRFQVCDVQQLRFSRPCPVAYLHSVKLTL
jgi:hypothetical protein